MEEDDEDDLTGDMEDPTPENSISEVKITPMNAGKVDLQPSKGASSYMDMDEADVGGEKDENSRDVSGSGMGHPISNKEDTDDNVTEQTHHIIVPSYRFVCFLFLSPSVGVLFSLKPYFWLQ